VIGWVLDMLDDIASDMSAFHRVDDIEAMPTGRFFAFAARLPAYRGAVRFRFEQVADQLTPEPPRAGGVRHAPATAGATEVPSTPVALTALVPGVVDFAGG
jgi:hypothetical protein